MKSGWRLNMKQDNTCFAKTSLKAWVTLDDMV